MDNYRNWAELCRKWLKEKKTRKRGRRVGQTKLTDEERVIHWRAAYLINRYKQSDAEHNREKCDFNIYWMIENIFSKQCLYCGKTDWKEMGCHRLDNSKGHIKGNVVPVCKKCHRKLPSGLAARKMN